MKTYIKENKIYETPITIIDGDNKIITNSDEVIKSYGYTEYIAPERSLESLINESNAKINGKTDRKILNDFVWNGNEFYLSMENQFNFKNLYDLREIKEYPVTIKTKTGFITLDSKEEVEDFFLAGVQFIENCLKECWQKKLDAETELRKRYQ